MWSKNPIKEPYYMHGKQLEVVQDTKYLGITVKDDLIWNLHINNIVSSANQVQGMLSMVVIVVQGSSLLVLLQVCWQSCRTSKAWC
jgi:hypothetical protein